MGYAETLTSAATDVVSAAPPANNPAPGAPAIIGTAQVGETLTVDTTSIADPDGMENASFRYTWFGFDGHLQLWRMDSLYPTFVVLPQDEGITIKVKVSFTDDAGNDEELTSAPTDEVAPAPNSPATGAPTIISTVQVGETPTADRSGISDRTD